MADFLYSFPKEYVSGISMNSGTGIEVLRNQLKCQCDGISAWAFAVLSFSSVQNEG